MANWLEVSWRTLVAVLILFVLTKLLGKRQVSQLSIFEYITGITIGSLAAYISLDMETTWHLGIISLVVWVAVSLGIEFLQLKSKKVRDFIDGKGAVLIRDGKILEENLKKERLSADELMEQLRAKQIFKVADVEFAIIEPSGEINVLPKPEAQPVTPKQLGLKLAAEKEPQVVIMDGKVMYEPLSAIGRNPAWLDTQLKQMGVEPDEVFLGQVDSSGQLYVDLYDDLVKAPESRKEDILMATLNKCQADMELFGLTTKNKEAQKTYEQCAKQLQDVMMNIKPAIRKH